MLDRLQDYETLVLHFSMLANRKDPSAIS
jgi:hypothetical protein